MPLGVGGEHDAFPTSVGLRLSQADRRVAHAQGLALAIDFDHSRLALHAQQLHALMRLARAQEARRCRVDGDKGLAARHARERYLLSNGRTGQHRQRGQR
ncbi:hypothetical protein D9M69_659950 [compost metagenome]